MATAYYIGLDVHKDFIQMAVMTNEDEQTVCERKLANDNGLLVRTIKPYQEKGEVQVAYEAGCLGYVIQRGMTEAGIDCRVLPADKVAKTRTDKIKTDKRDARLIARMLRRGEGKGINVPTAEDEAAQDRIYCG
jgi:transposase